jgi:hypothetical protein
LKEALARGDDKEEDDDDAGLRELVIDVDL